jgi:hypothetical protein
LPELLIDASYLNFSIACFFNSPSICFSYTSTMGNCEASRRAAS